MDLTLVHEEELTIIPPDWPPELLGRKLSNYLKNNMIEYINNSSTVNYLDMLDYNFMDKTNEYLKQYKTINRVLVIDYLPMDHSSFLYWLINQKIADIILTVRDNRILLIGIIGKRIYFRNDSIDLYSASSQSFEYPHRIPNIPGINSTALYDKLRLIRHHNYSSTIIINQSNGYSLTDFLHIRIELNGSDGIPFTLVSEPIGYRLYFNDINQAENVICLVSDDFVILGLYSNMMRHYPSQSNPEQFSHYVKVTVLPRQFWENIEKYLINNWSRVRVEQLQNTRSREYSRFINNTENERRYMIEMELSELREVLIRLK